MELKLKSTIKLQPQNPIFRFTHRARQTITPKSTGNMMILIPTSWCAVVKSQERLGKADEQLSAEHPHWAVANAALMRQDPVMSNDDPEPPKASRETAP